ncbi:MAG: 3-isopropylmalate dehydratase large subunit [Candidatus Methanomethyliaceae archaeon]|nr:3-isopropylmalate dehydratase large subunit [Candidatus Methanomethyliaceae archaeon]
MGMTIAEKILARASGKSKVEPGDYVVGKIDLAMVHDLTGPLTLNVLKEIGYDRPWDPRKIVIILDHQVPANSTVTASLHQQLREYANKYGTNFHDVGRQGVCHQILAESYVKPGMLVVGADSHTCTLGALGSFATGIGSTEMASVFLTGELWFRVPETIRFELKGTLKQGVSAKDIILYIIGKMGVDGALYCATEFTGEGVERLSIDSRLTICNMAIEMGGKTGIVNPDAKTLEYTKCDSCEILRSDKDAEYQRTIEVVLEDLVPQVSLPHSVDNVKPVSEVEGIEVDQVFIGSCTNGRLEDLEAAAKILHGRKVKEGTRLIVIPASPSVYIEAERRGYIKTFIEAGSVVCNPNCGPCLGGHMGILADGEVCVSTSNRNFIGRMGSPKSKVYLVSPETAAATAVEGKLTDPLKYVRS